MVIDKYISTKVAINRAKVRQRKVDRAMALDKSFKFRLNVLLTLGGERRIM